MNVRQPTLQDAFALHGQGRLGEAARIYEAIAAREPGNAEARHYLGAILASAGRLQDAKALMKRALELKPSEFAFLENYVGVLVLAEDFGEALELGRTALKRQPRNANVLYLNAASLQKLDRLDEARAAFVALLRLAPDHLAGRKEYAVTLTRLGEHDEALRAVEALIAERPRFADAYLVRANIRSIRGEFGLALADYERALALQPNAHETWLSYGRALDTIGRFEQALAAFDRALALRPNYVDALVGRGAVLKLMNRLPEALACFDRAIALGGDGEAKGLAARGAALAEAGDTEEARLILRRAIDGGANSAVAWLAYADLDKFDAGDSAFAAMESRLAEVERRQPSEAQALHFALAKAYLDVGDSERAFVHLDAGNHMKRAQLAYDADANRAHTAAIAAAFQPETFARFAGAGSPSATPIFVVGMPRSGTTPDRADPRQPFGDSRRRRIARAAPDRRRHRRRARRPRRFDGRRPRAARRRLSRAGRRSARRQDARRRQAAGQFRQCRPDPPDPARSAHHPRPPRRDRHLPLLLLQVLQGGQSPLHLRSDRAWAVLSRLRQADGALAHEPAGGPISSRSITKPWSTISRGRRGA